MNEPPANATNDRAVLEAVVEEWLDGWRRGDAALATEHYADDADWTNAFGVRRRGRTALRSTLEEIFSRAHVMAGSDAHLGNEIRFVGAKVALVWTRIERTGQQMPSGQPLGIRRTTHLRVFAMSGSGWQIVSHLISDARHEETTDH